MDFLPARATIFHRNFSLRRATNAQEDLKKLGYVFPRFSKNKRFASHGLRSRGATDAAGEAAAASSEKAAALGLPESFRQKVNLLPSHAAIVEGFENLTAARYSEPLERPSKPSPHPAQGCSPDGSAAR